MTDFVLEHPASTDYEWQLSNHLRYAKFLTQPLEPGMFVPCDDDGNILEEPNDYFPEGIESDYSKKYQKAKEKVLFEGFRVVDNDSKSHPKTIQFQSIFNPFWFLRETNSWHSSKRLKTIEDLIKFNLELTETGFKYFYGC